MGKHRQTGAWETHEGEREKQTLTLFQRTWSLKRQWRWHRCDSQIKVGHVQYLPLSANPNACFLFSLYFPIVWEYVYFSSGLNLCSALALMISRPPQNQTCSIFHDLSLTKLRSPEYRVGLAEPNHTHTQTSKDFFIPSFSAKHCISFMSV